MKLSDIKAGMKIRAVADWCDCWKAGDEFVVFEDDGQPAIFCHHLTPGTHHGLDWNATNDGDLPGFEPVEAS